MSKLTRLVAVGAVGVVAAVSTAGVSAIAAPSQYQPQPPSYRDTATSAATSISKAIAAKSVSAVLAKNGIKLPISTLAAGIYAVKLSGKLPGNSLETLSTGTLKVKTGGATTGTVSLKTTSDGAFFLKNRSKFGKAKTIAIKVSLGFTATGASSAYPVAQQSTVKNK